MSPEMKFIYVRKLKYKDRMSCKRTIGGDWRLDLIDISSKYSHSLILSSDRDSMVCITNNIVQFWPGV